MPEFKKGDTVWFYNNGWLEPVEYVYVSSDRDPFRELRLIVYRRGNLKIQHTFWADGTIHATRCKALEAKAKWIRENIKTLEILREKATVVLAKVNQQISEESNA